MNASKPKSIKNVFGGTATATTTNQLNVENDNRKKDRDQRQRRGWVVDKIIIFFAKYFESMLSNLR